MTRPETADEALESARKAPHVRDRAKATIVENAQLYGGLYFVAIPACVVLIFYAGWFRWVAGFLVVACLMSAWNMRRTLSHLGNAYVQLGWGDAVLGKHRALNAFALALLVYAFLAVWRGWPLPLVAVLIAALINFAHYAGYRDTRQNG